jgi:hypothetical protein
MDVLGKIIPDHPTTTPILPMTCLQGPSYYLSHTLRDLVLGSWNVRLPALQGGHCNRRWNS